MGSMVREKVTEALKLMSLSLKVPNERANTAI